MVSSTEPAVGGGRVAWAAVAERGLRTLAPITVAAVGLSVLIGGVGGRLVMSLLSATNPDNDGRISDDGFVIGRFDLGGTVQLVGFSVQVGLAAAACYLVARQLVFGPRWFQVTSMAVGAGTVVGALIVHPDGIDFTAFDPPWLPILLFVAIPVVYVACLALLAEHWVASEQFQSVDLRMLSLVTVVLWALGAVTLVLLIAVVATWGVWQLVRDTAIGTAVRSQVSRWVARAALVLIFVAAVTNLIDDTSVLV
jgi:hypothetical protein